MQLLYAKSLEEAVGDPNLLSGNSNNIMVYMC